MINKGQRDAMRSQHGRLFQFRECLNYPAIASGYFFASPDKQVQVRNI
ncbi:MAG: hypothetical protein V7L31_29190 [Nostoc sp.]